MIPYIIFLIALVIASYTDVKTREIPLRVFPIETVIVFMYYILIHERLKDHFIGALIMFLLFFVSSLFGMMGGGDVIMMSAAGFVIGIQDMILFTICMAVTGTIIVIIMRKKGKQPMAPFVLAAFILFLIAKI